MADGGGGHITDTLVILIFVYLAGIVTGILGFAYWRRPTADKEEEEEAEVPAPPPPQPEPALLIEKIRVVVPPPAVRVGITSSCYAYHDVDNPDVRCDEMKAFAAQTEGRPGGKPSKRFYPCKWCFPEGSYSDQRTEYHFAPDGQPIGVRPRQRVRDVAPIEVYD